LTIIGFEREGEIHIGFSSAFKIESIRIGKDFILPRLYFIPYDRTLIPAMSVEDFFKIAKDNDMVNIQVRYSNGLFKNYWIPVNTIRKLVERGDTPFIYNISNIRRRDRENA
jgi:hypothetical protein